MSPFNRANDFLLMLATMALSRVVSEIFNIEKYRDLEIPVKSQSRSLKVVLFDRLGIGFLLVFYSNYTSLRYSTSKMPWPWKPG